jgi:hypothetical protein
VHCLHCSSVLYNGAVWLVYIVRIRLVYILWLFYIVRVYSIFQAEFFCDIFVFLQQILAEFFIITSEISRPDDVDKTIYRKQFGNFRKCAGFNLTKEHARRKMNGPPYITSCRQHMTTTVPVDAKNHPQFRY